MPSVPVARLTATGVGRGRKQHLQAVYRANVLIRVTSCATDEAWIRDAAFAGTGRFDRDAGPAVFGYLISVNTLPCAAIDQGRQRHVPYDGQVVLRP